jgi:hypothetical protein
MTRRVEFYGEVVTPDLERVMAVQVTDNRLNRQLV